MKTLTIILLILTTKLYASELQNGRYEGFLNGGEDVLWLEISENGMLKTNFAITYNNSTEVEPNLSFLKQLKWDNEKDVFKTDGKALLKCSSQDTYATVYAEILQNNDTIEFVLIAPKHADCDSLPNGVGGWMHFFHKLSRIE